MERGGQCGLYCALVLLSANVLMHTQMLSYHLGSEAFLQKKILISYDPPSEVQKNANVLKLALNCTVGTDCIM